MSPVETAAPDRPDDPVCDLRFGQVGLANVRILRDDPQALRDDIEHRVRSAPSLFERTAVVIDLSHLGSQPADEAVRALLGAVRDGGMLPVGIAYGSGDTEALSRRLDLPLIARFRAVFERQADSRPATAKQKATKPAPARDEPDEPTLQASMVHAQQVRSGQQIYAQQRDLVVTAAVASGAEVIADGSIHVYGCLRGRALAGALGQTQARIFCTDFNAQLISIAGHYRVFEEVPEEFEGKSVQCWLEDDKLMLASI